VPDDQRWVIPVRLRIGTRDGVIDERVLLDGDHARLQLVSPPEWVCANAEGLGFYRTCYDDAAFAALSAAVDELHPLERFGLVDDSWALMLGDRAGIDRVVAAVHAVRDDQHPAVVRRTLAALAELRLLAGAEGRDPVAAFARRLVEDRHDDDPEVAGLVLRLSGITGADPVAIERARAMVEQPADVHPELVSAAIDVAAANGDAADFDEYRSRFASAATPQEELRYLSALTRFPEAELIDRVLEMCATEVRTQNAPYALAQAMSNPVHGGRAWYFVRDRWDDLVARFPDNSLARMVGGVRSVWEPEVAADVLAFFAVERLPHSVRPVAQHLELVRTHQATRGRERDALLRALR
jgi:puromycin-sensitive aminopeptidase